MEPVSETHYPDSSPEEPPNSEGGIIIGTITHNPRKRKLIVKRGKEKPGLERDTKENN